MYKWTHGQIYILPINKLLTQFGRIQLALRRTPTLFVCDGCVVCALWGLCVFCVLCVVCVVCALCVLCCVCVVMMMMIDDG